MTEKRPDSGKTISLFKAALNINLNSFHIKGRLEQHLLKE